MIEKKYCRMHIGKVFTTNEGYESTIVDGGSKTDYCTVKIMNWEYEAQYTNVKGGRVKYP
jgi:hypothetical protein